MQSITVTGRLGRDPQIHEPSGNGGEAFATFTMASNSRVKGNEKTTWYDVIVNVNRRTQGIINILKKGYSVAVVGELDVSTYEGNDGTRVRLSVSCNHIEFNGVKESNPNGGDASAPQAEENAAPKAAKPAKKVTEVPEDIPMTDSKPAQELFTDSSDSDLPF